MVANHARPLRSDLEELKNGVGKLSYTSSRLSLLQRLVYTLLMALHRKKYEQAVLYLGKKLGGEIRGKKKLAKLLYFADFDFYEKYQRSITGDVYRAFPKGPLPVRLGDMIDGLVAKKELEVHTVKEWGEEYAPTEVYRVVSASGADVLDEQERQMLDRIVKRYGALNGEQLAELSHAEAPYTAALPYEEVPFEFTYYRGTDFADL